MSSLEDLARRVQRLEDIDEIKCVKARYCAACDRGYDADAIATLYSVDGVWDGGRTFGKVVGREKIRKFFVGASQRVLIARHQVGFGLIALFGACSSCHLDDVSL